MCLLYIRYITFSCFQNISGQLEWQKSSCDEWNDNRDKSYQNVLLGKSFWEYHCKAQKVIFLLFEKYLYLLFTDSSIYWQFGILTLTLNFQTWDVAILENWINQRTGLHLFIPLSKDDCFLYNSHLPSDGQWCHCFNCNQGIIF